MRLYLIRFGNDDPAVTRQVEIVENGGRTVEPGCVRAAFPIFVTGIFHPGAVRFREHILKGYNRDLIDGLDRTLSRRVVATN